MTSMQDRQKTLTIEQLRQRYNLDDIGKTKKAIQLVKETLNKTETELNQFVNSTTKNLKELQDQVDGNITTWFFNGIPTAENEPAKNWTTEKDKANHIGDLYYDQDTGYAYRWAYEENSYMWSKIVDADVVKALAVANSAQDTADSKRRVFVEQPIPPYDIGDIWLKEDSELYRCRCARIEEDKYNVSDWIIATKYTDDTVALETKGELNQFKTEVKENYTSNATFETTVNSINGKVEETYKYTTTVENKVNGLSDSVETVVNNSSALKIRVDGISSEVSTKVGEDVIISKVNQSAESVKIQASKLDVDAIATFTNNKLAEAGSTIINGSNIITGKIKASVIEGYEKLTLSVKNNTDAIGDRTGKSTTITQDINSIASQISDIADITSAASTSNGTILSSELKNIASSYPIRIEIKPINTNISYLYPNSKLFPSSTTFLKTRKLRFTNESTNEIFDYILPDNLLYYDENTYDEFIADYDENVCKVIKRCKYNADGTVGLLSQPLVKEYNFTDEIQTHFNLTEGNYNVKLLGYREGYIFVRLMVLNAYTAQYATKVELGSSIKQTSKEIMSQVSITYETKDKVEKQYTEIKQTTNSINQTVANNNTKANIVAKINDNTSQIKIQADNVDINGMISAINNNTSTTINGNKITTGTITADKILANSITSQQVSSDIITTSNFSAQNINADKITSGTISTSRLSSDVITTSNFSAQTINADKITAGTLNVDRIPNLSANKITSGTMLANRISGGTLSISDASGGYFSVGTNTTHAFSTGLNIGAAGLNISNGDRSGKILLSADANYGYIRSMKGLSYIFPLDKSGNTIKNSSNKAMSFYDVFAVVKYCMAHSYYTNL